MDLGVGGRWNTPALQVLAISQSLESLGYAVPLLDINESRTSLRQWRGALVMLIADTCGPEAPVPARWRQPHGFRIGLEQEGIPFLGSAFAALQRSSTGSKHRCRSVLSKAGLTVPRGVLVRRSVSIAGVDDGTTVIYRRLCTSNGQRLVVKANEGSGGGVGVHLVKSADELADILRWHHVARQGDAVVEQYIEGREFSVWVKQREGRAEVYGFLEFRKPTSQPLLDQGAKMRLRRVRRFSKTVRAAPQVLFQPSLATDLECQLAHAALTAFSACGLRHYARIDMIASAEGVVVIDVNAHPDLGPTWLGQTAQARGEHYRDVLRCLITEALARQ